MGWLHATPEKKKQSRLAEFGEDNPVCDMPSADTLIVTWFHQLGRCTSNGMGVVAVSFTELSAFNERMQLNLSPWESEILVNMSREYSVMLNSAKDPLMSAPWHSEHFDELEHARARAVKNARAMKEAVNRIKKPR